MASYNTTATALLTDENRGPGLLALAWIEAIVALGFVSARFYCRGLVLRKLGADDWTMLVAFILSLASTVCITIQISFGLGRHIIHLQRQQAHTVLKFMTVDEPFVTFSTCFGKISVCFLLLRIMRGRIMDSTRRFKIFIWILIISFFLVTLGCLAVNFAECTPVWKIWEISRLDPSCLDPRIHLYIGLAQSAYSCLTDAILAILPYLIIRHIQMPRKLKAGLISLLSLGLFAAAVALVKTIQLRNIVSNDLTWDLSFLTPWLPTEQYVIIVAACIPTLKPLFKSSPRASAVDPPARLVRQVSGSWSVGESSLRSDTVGSRSHRSVDRLPLGNKCLASESTLADLSLMPVYLCDRGGEGCI